MAKLTAARARELLDYDPETGVFLWLVPGRRRKVGAKAGGLSAEGRVKIMIEGRSYYAHRLAWLIFHGRFPRLFIDHRNGLPADNRIENLREATNSQNCANQRRKKMPRSGFRGVREYRGKWVARVCKNSRVTHIGVFGTPEEAHAAYVAATRRLHGEFANGQ